jgi:GNAT superfamily N-acetyltransferase
MKLRIRPATLDDVEAIRSFATNTFTWGDYVADALPGWLASESSLVLVAAGEDDTAVAVARVVQLSEREVWLHGARVHPDHRRRGVASLLNQACCDWARGRGAAIARLLIDAWNEPARRQVTSIGYRPVAEWVSATVEIGTEVVPTRNGGRRVPAEERLAPGRAAEADVAWMSWVNGDIARAGRELFALGWLLRRIRPADLTEAARDRALWQSPSGWLVARLDTNGQLFVPWISTTDVDVTRMVRAIFDLAEGVRAESVRMLVPRVPWLVEALSRAGYTLDSHTVLARHL